MSLPVILAQAQPSGGDGPGCPPGPSNVGTFHDAFDFILHKRESVSGGVCIGGPGDLWELTQTHLAVSFVAIAAAILISVPIGLWLGHVGKGEFIAVSVSNVGRAVPSLALLAFFAGGGGLGENIYSSAAGTGGRFFKSNVVVAGGLAVLLAALGDLIILSIQRFALPWRRAAAR